MLDFFDDISFETFKEQYDKAQAFLQESDITGCGIGIIKNKTLDIVASEVILTVDSIEMDKDCYGVKRRKVTKVFPQLADAIAVFNVAHRQYAAIFNGEGELIQTIAGL